MKSPVRHYDEHVVAYVRHITESKLKRTQVRFTRYTQDMRETLMPFRVDLKGRDGLVISFDFARSKTLERALQFALEMEKAA